MWVACRVGDLKPSGRLVMSKSLEYFTMQRKTGWKQIVSKQKTELKKKGAKVTNSNPNWQRNSKQKLSESKEKVSNKETLERKTTLKLDWEGR